MTKKLFYTIFLIFSIYNSFSQSYIVSDTMCYSNVNLLSSTAENNSLYVVLGIDKKRPVIAPVTGDTVNGVLTKSVLYTPEMIDGYGLKDGRTYLSRDIDINGFKQKVFLQVLTNGDKRLLLFVQKNTKYYFIETADSGELIYLHGGNKKEIVNQLSGIFSDFDVTKGVNRKIKFNEAILTKLVTNYNSKTIPINTFSKYGIILGFSESSYIPKTEYDPFLKSISNIKQNVFLAGLSADIPILKTSFALHTELYFINNSVSYDETDGAVKYNISVKNFSMSVPLMLKYNYEFKHLVPYINAGIVYTYNFNNENIYTQTEMDYTMDKTRFVELVSNNRLGYSGGIGIAKKINYASSVYFEIRYTSQGNFLSNLVDGGYLSKKDMSIIAGFNF